MSREYLYNNGKKRAQSKYKISSGNIFGVSEDVNSYSQALISGSFDDRKSDELVGPSDYQKQHLLGNIKIV